MTSPKPAPCRSHRDAVTDEDTLTQEREMIYDDNGNPKFLGYSIEPYWGEYWVCRVASKLMLSTEDAIKLLETGGHGGGHCDEKVVFSWLAD